MFWFAVIPGLLAVALLVAGVHEPETSAAARPARAPIHRETLRELSGSYWWIVAVGAIFTLARFSEAFLILRARQSGLADALAPAVLILMNVVYAASAYPAGRLADHMDRRFLLAGGLLVLIAANLALARAQGLAMAALGVALWGLHMGLTQGLLATMVAAAAPGHLRGTAFGFFNLASGGAMLAASVLAGTLWDTIGASATFYAGAIFSAVALALLMTRQAPRIPPTPSPAVKEA